MGPMTDPPSSDGRTVRSDSASRLAALLADVVENPAPAPIDDDAPAPGGTGASGRGTGGGDADGGAVDGGTAEGPEQTDGDIAADPQVEVGRDAAGDMSDEAGEQADGDTSDEDGEHAVPVAAVEAAPPVATRADVDATTGDLAGAEGPEVGDRDAAVVAATGSVEASDAGGDPSTAGVEVATASDPAAEATGERAEAARATVDTPPDDARSDDAPFDVDAQPADDGDIYDDGQGPPPLRRVTLRSVAFGTVLTLLVAAIPALGYLGQDRLLKSRGGDVVVDSAGPTEPGYRAFVTPTPTALVVNRDAEGNPASATLLALGAGDDGGTVLQVPLTTMVHNPIMIRRLIGIWEHDRDDESFRRTTEEILGISIPAPLIDVTDESLAALIAPVAPLEITGTDPIVDEDGVQYAGDISLAAEQVGPYLRATYEGEAELAHLARTERVWQAWLAALGEAGVDDAVGAATTGIGPFLRALAGGTAMVETLDVQPDEPMYFGDIPPLIPTDRFEAQVVDAVPFPHSPSPGRRATIQLLNGSEGATVPMALMHDLVLAGGAVITVGNADAFGRETTLVEYSGTANREVAADLAAVLGDDVEVEQMSATRAEAEAEDLVITIGSDVLERYDDGG